MIEKLILSIDKYINPASRTRALRYGLLTGLLTFSCLLGCELIGFIRFPMDKFVYFFIFAPFLMGIFFLRMNSFLWQKMRRIELNMKAIDIKNCGCELTRLPAYGELGWMRARINEYYTCVLFGFICGFIFGWCLAVLVGVLILYLFYRR